MGDGQVMFTLDRCLGKVSVVPGGESKDDFPGSTLALGHPFVHVAYTIGVEATIRQTP